MSRDPAQRTFLFSDIEGSTRLLTRLGDAYQVVHADYQRLLRAAWAAHGGEEQGTEGDSFFVVFRTAGDGIRAAADAHRALAAHAWPAGADVRVRIGLHTGQAVRVGQSLLGLDVHRAARIAAAGHGGQTLLSEATSEAVTDEPDIDTGPGPGDADLSLRDLGRHRLKDVGVIRLWQLDVAGLPTVTGRLRTVEEHPTNLPGGLSSLLDRDAERADATAALASAAVVTLTGAGGIGKSRVAIDVARAAIDGFPDGVFYCDAASLEDADALAARLLATVDVETDGAAPPSDAIVDVLRGRTALLVLDNVDRVDGASVLAAAIARAASSARLLVTSRAPLRIGGEREVAIGPLALPPGPASPADDVATGLASPAVALFVTRAREVNPDFELSSANADAVIEICARLDGLPLAIELAAARTRVLSVTALRDRLARRLPVLAGGARDAPDRQRTMRDAIAWSYDLLDEPERALLDRLAVFEGAFGLAGAEAVGADVGGTGELDPRLLEALVERSLVSPAGGSGHGDPTEPAFRLLGTIREFALERLEAAGAAEAARDRHLRFLLSFVRAERARTDLDDVAVGRRIDGLSADWAAALDRAFRTPAPSATAVADGIALAAALGPHWWEHGHRRDGLDWLERAVGAAGVPPVGDQGATTGGAAPEEVDPRAVADVLRWAGVLHEVVGDDERARQRLEAAHDRLVALGDRLAQARVLNSLGVVVRSQDDLDGAQQLLMQALALRRQLGDRRGLAATLTNLGIVEVDRGNHEAALELLDEAWALDRAAGVRIGMAYSGLARGSALAGLGRLEEAAQSVLGAIETYADLGDADGVCDALDEVAGVAARRGDPRGAMRLFLAADALRQRDALRVRPVDRRRRDALVAPARALVDTATLEQLAAESRAVDLATAVALARATSEEDRGPPGD